MLRWLRANGCEWDAGNLSDGGARGVRNARVDPASRCSQPNEDWGGNLHGAAFCLATILCGSELKYMDRVLDTLLAVGTAVERLHREGQRRFSALELLTRSLLQWVWAEKIERSVDKI